MTASVITGLRQNLEELEVGRMPYIVELRGQRETRVKVDKIQDLNTGKLSVRIASQVAAGKPVVALSTLDAIARKLLAGARVSSHVKGAQHIRIYEQ